MKDVVIVSAARTPVGAFQGALSTTPAYKLGAAAIKAAVERAGIKPELVDHVIFGNVLMAAQGQAPARQATLEAGLPDSATTLTVNKVCGSGLKTVHLAAQAVMCGDAEIVVAGGMENMSMAPYAMPRARSGLRMNTAKGDLLDLMVHDGLWDPQNDQHMGSAADLCSKEKDLPREAMDDFAAESYRRSQKAVADGLFKEEIVPVEVKGRKGKVTVVDTDEGPAMVKFEKIPQLRPAFNKDGTVTAANASSINDGAAAVVVMSADKAKELGLKPMARFVSYAEGATEWKWFTIAPPISMHKALEKAEMKIEDIDLFEINEAFACVTMYAMREFGLDNSKVNVRGGAIAIGHPIGASGARLLVTLLHAMKDRGDKTGLVSLCIGGGEGNTMIVEAL